MSHCYIVSYMLKDCKICGVPDVKIDKVTDMCLVCTRAMLDKIECYVCHRTIGVLQDTSLLKTKMMCVSCYEELPVSHEKPKETKKRKTKTKK